MTLVIAENYGTSARIMADTQITDNTVTNPIHIPQGKPRSTWNETDRGRPRSIWDANIKTVKINEQLVVAYAGKLKEANQALEELEPPVDADEAVNHFRTFSDSHNTDFIVLSTEEEIELYILRDGGLAKIEPENYGHIGDQGAWDTFEENLFDEDKPRYPRHRPRIAFRTLLHSNTCFSVGGFAICVSATRTGQLYYDTQFISMDFGVSPARTHESVKASMVPNKAAEEGIFTCNLRCCSLEDRDLLIAYITPREAGIVFEVDGSSFPSADAYKGVNPAEFQQKIEGNFSIDGRGSTGISARSFHLDWVGRLLEQRQIEETRAYIDQFLPDLGKTNEELTIQSRLHYELGQYQKAIESLKKKSQRYGLNRAE